MGCPRLKTENWVFLRGGEKHLLFPRKPREKNRSRSAPAEMDDACPFLFSSEYLDSETGLVYYNYRYYSPELGRWTKRDPIGEDGGLNLYAMVGNDSVSKIDIWGRRPKEGEPMQISSRSKKSGVDPFPDWWLKPCPCAGKKCCKKEAWVELLKVYLVKGGKTDSPQFKAAVIIKNAKNTKYFWWTCYSRKVAGKWHAGPWPGQQKTRPTFIPTGMAQGIIIVGVKVSWYSCKGSDGKTKLGKWTRYTDQKTITVNYFDDKQIEPFYSKRSGLPVITGWHINGM